MLTCLVVGCDWGITESVGEGVVADGRLVGMVLMGTGPLGVIIICYSVPNKFSDKNLATNFMLTVAHF